ncbi:MAG: hypothetical protein ABIT01_06655 [Thermoanaerobaculia bacterium]
MSASITNPCRAFEERLAESLELRLSALDGSGAFPADAHAPGCPSCASLLADLEQNHRDFHRLKSPLIPVEFLERLRALPSDFAVRRETESVLALLTPGTLSQPKPSPELMSRLAFLPARSRAGLAHPVKRSGLLQTLRGLVTDWRFAVAGAYVAAILIVTILKIDPLSVARGAASDLTSVGEHAMAEAKTIAVDRLKDTKLARVATPLTKRFDYKLYRTVAAGQARAKAYSQLLFEKVLGTATDSRDTRQGSSAFSGSRDRREPNGRALRS